MDFPDDPKVTNIGDQYMLGPAFLVAPVTGQGQTSRAVYLPVGADWYDYWTNRRYTGGQTIEAAAPIDRIPLFVWAMLVTSFLVIMAMPAIMIASTSLILDRLVVCGSPVQETDLR